MRSPSPGFVLFISILALILSLGAALADESSNVASGIAISQCGKTVGLILVDEQGQLHPVDPTALENNQTLLDKLLTQIPKGKGVTVTVPCVKDENKIV